MSPKIQLLSLDRSVTEEQIQTLFSSIGPVRKVQVMRDREKKSMGLAIVEMAEASDAAQAVQKLNGAQLGSQSFMAVLMKGPKAPPKKLGPLPMTPELFRIFFSFHENWEIKPGVGVGPLKLGMSEQEVESHLGPKTLGRKENAGYHAFYRVNKESADRKLTAVKTIAERDPYTKSRFDKNSFGITVEFDENGKAWRFDFDFTDHQVSLNGQPLLGVKGAELQGNIRKQDPKCYVLASSYVVSRGLLLRAIAFDLDSLGSEINDYCNSVSVFSQKYYDLKLKSEVEPVVPEPVLSEEETVSLLKQSPFWAARKENVLQLQFEESAGDGNLVGSKLGGHPMASGEIKSPKCKECDKDLSLLLQLDLEASGVFEHLARGTASGWLQVFFCFNDECESQSEMGEVSESAAIRLVAKSSDAAVKKIKRPLEEHRIVALNGSVDVDEMPIDAKDNAWVKALPTETQEQFLSSVAHYFPQASDKLGGFPRWVQDPEIPQCESCRKEKRNTSMKFVLQIESHQDWNVMFGDLGSAYVFQCPHHSDRFALIWQCS